MLEVETTMEIRVRIKYEYEMPEPENGYNGGHSFYDLEIADTPVSHALLMAMTEKYQSEIDEAIVEDVQERIYNGEMRPPRRVA